MNQETLQKIADHIETPFFVYDESVLKKNINRILNASKENGLFDQTFLFTSYFANSNPHIFRHILSEKVGILLQTKEEWYQIQEHELKTKIIVSPSFLSEQEIDFWKEKEIPINLSSQEEVYDWAKKYGTPPSLRLDLSFWQKQRTGIKKKQLQKLVDFLNCSNIFPRSIHVYCGTGSSLKEIQRYAKKTIQIWRQYFSNTKEINFGGGFGFDYESDDSEKKHFPWKIFFHYLKSLVHQYQIPSDVQFFFEPGRDVLADAGKMIIRVCRVVHFPNSTEVATDGSFVYMPSATKRNRSHQTLFFDKNFQKQKTFPFFRGKLSGSTTLSHDYILPLLIKIPKNIKKGDFIAIQDVGAYGATQHLEFLNKKPCPEVLINKDSIFLIAKRGRETDKTRNLLQIPKEI